MSGQQSMFADPEHRPPESRMYNTDPQEQSWSGSEEAHPLYAEEFHQAQRGGAKIQPEQSKKRHRVLAIVPLILLAVLLLGGFSLLRSGLIFPIPSAQVSQVVYNSQGFVSPERVIIQDAAGNVHVHSSSQDNVLIMSTNGADKSRIRYRQEGDTMVVFVDDGNSPFASTIDLDIALPQSSSVQVDSRSGSVDLTDMSGLIQAQTDSGEIHAQNLTGQVGLHTSSGDIDVQGLRGQTVLQTSSGAINVNQASLSGDSAISTFSGSITYNGSLAPGNLYRFLSASGDVRLNLPSNSSLAVETRTSSGDVQNDFDNMMGVDASSAHVAVITASGNIAIKRAS